jgi:hypothetical protein
MSNPVLLNVVKGRNVELVGGDDRAWIIRMNRTKPSLGEASGPQQGGRCFD